MNTRRRSLLLVAILLVLFISASTVDAAWNKNKKPPPPPKKDDSSLVASEDLTVAGQLLPAVKKFLLSGNNLKSVINALKEAIEVKEFALLAILGWASVPVINILHDVYVNVVDRIKSDDITPEEASGKEFTDTYLYHFVQDVAHVARVRPGKMHGAFTCENVI